MACGFFEAKNSRFWFTVQMTKVFEALDTHYTKCCATCKHWKDVMSQKNTGKCEWAPEGETFNFVEHGVGIQTLDLALCSKWQHKEDAE